MQLLVPFNNIAKYLGLHKNSLGKWVALFVFCMFISACNDDKPNPDNTAPDASTATGEESPSSTYAPTIYLDTTAPNGFEAFISIGGVIGSNDSLARNQIENAYRAAGFRVHTIMVPMSFAAIQTVMTNVAAEYQRGSTTLNYVVFHHAGHGWDDHITYERAGPTRGSTKHTVIFSALGSTFPITTQQFLGTQFGAVFDACGQGKAAALKVGGRHGFVASASPPAVAASTCASAGCSYVCENCWTQTVPTYTYSANFARILQAAPPPPNQITNAMQGAHNAGVIALEQGGSPSTGCGGVFTRY